MEEREQIQQAISSLESQRPTLGDLVVETALYALRERLERLDGRSRAPSVAQQRKQVTVLFADVSGFTAMSENMDHEEVGTVINSLWTRVDEAIIHHGGRIDKHIGDAVMALFGAPTAREDDPERAIRAALRVQSELEAWKQEYAAANPPLKAQVLGLRLRIGVNTGPALIGTVGTTGEYTAIGDTVNLASRMESSATVGSILISHNTYRHVPEVFEVAPLEPIKVKGKKEPIRVYRVDGIRPRALRTAGRGVKGVRTRMIGRDVELALLQARYRQSISLGRTRLITVVAEAGTGKSRLLSEFARWLQTQPDQARVLTGRASPDMAMSPAALIRDLLSAVYEIQDADRAALARQKLEDGMRGPESGDAHDTAPAHFIGQLIGFDFSNSPHLTGILADAQQVRDLAFHYLGELFAEWTRAQPVLLLLEDVHWADSTSLEFFDFLLRSYPDLPLFILCSARATVFEQHPEWAAESDRRLRLDLQPLSREECGQLVLEILHQVPDVPSALVNLILDKAEGSPFYVEELVNVLIDGGVVVTGDAEWHIEMAQLPRLNVPATLTGLLQARLDTLSPPQLETLQQASVVGRVFWPSLLEQMQNPDRRHVQVPAEVLQSLDALKAKNLILRSQGAGPADAAEFLFKNGVLHDVTYESVLLRLRRIYHVQVAEGLVRLAGERAGESAGRVGEHYEKAGELARAAEWYVRAGKRAQETYATDAAASYYGKALSFLAEKSDPESLSLQREARQRLGEVLIWQARYTEAIGNYRSMLSESEDQQDLQAQAHALLGIAACLSSQGDQRQAMEHALRAEQVARQAGAHTEIARALWAQGSASYRLGEGQEALSRAEQALAISAELRDQNEMARCLNLLGAAYYSLGRYEESERYWEEALRLFQKLGDRRKGMDLLNNLGVIADARGDYSTAFQRYDDALEIARQMGYRDGEIVFLSNRGGEQVALGSYAAGEADLVLAIELAGTAGSWILPNTYYSLSEASLHLGKLGKALECGLTSLTLAKADGAPEYIGAAYRVLAMISKELHAPVEVPGGPDDKRELCQADELFGESLHVLEEGNIEGEQARTLREWARYELRDGNHELGAARWEQAREIFGRLGAQLEFERMAQLPP
jgi:class 3 adenylate cyclase/predicted ATPase